MVAGLLQRADAGVTTDASFGARQSFSSQNMLPVRLGTITITGTTLTAPSA